MANIRDVAKYAGVGVGTVSRVLNGTGSVSEEAKEKVFHAIKKLEYKPNELARNFFYNRAGIIGVIVPDLDHPFYSVFVKHVELLLCEADYRTMICNAVGNKNQEKKYLEMLERNIVDGIITVSHTLDDEEYLQTEKPIVSLDRDFGGKIPRISSDHEKTGILAAQRFLDCGCKNIIQFTGSSIARNKSIERNRVFSAYLLERGVRVTTVESAWNQFDFYYFDKIMREFMKDYPKVDGLFTMDIPAICAMNAAKEQGKRIPEDLKVIAVDGTYVTQLVSPQITAIVQPVEELAHNCVTALVALIEGKSVSPVQISDVFMRDGETT